MKTILKRILPYAIINGIIYAIIGAIIGKNIVEIHNTKKRISADSKAIKKYLKDIAVTCPNKMSFDEFEKMEDGDDRKPIEPIPIYVYD